MNELEKKINDIIAEWNPLCVDPTIARNEYKGYIPSIVESIRNRRNLEETIEHILEQMGIDSSLECVKFDIDNVCKVLCNLR